MASRFVGGSKFRRALGKLPESMRMEISAGLEDSIRAVQRTAVMLVPKHTGNLARLLSSRQAIGRRRKGLRWEFGLRTQSLWDRGYYAAWVEYGRKGYRAGDVRLAGVNKHGLGRYRKVKRDVPPRAPKPFLRPAFDIHIGTWRRNMKAAARRAVRRASRG